MATYNWDNKIVSRRFEECISVLNKLPSGLSFGHKSYWPDIKYTSTEIARMEKIKKHTILKPLPDAIDRAEETLAWITWIDKSEHRKLIWLRAQRIPWRAIARELGISTRTAGRHYEQQLSVVVNQLNSSE